MKGKKMSAAKGEGKYTWYRGGHPRATARHAAWCRSWGGMTDKPEVGNGPQVGFEEISSKPVSGPYQLPDDSNFVGLNPTRGGRPLLTCLPFDCSASGKRPLAREAGRLTPQLSVFRSSPAQRIPASP
jgi:hypothetical protein